MKRLFLMLTVVLLSVGCGNKKLDKMLDRYESCVNSGIELVDKAQKQGRDLSARQEAELWNNVEEINELKTQLRAVQSDFTKSQRERFDRITDKLIRIATGDFDDYDDDFR